jgi:hypothetical protein
LQHLCNSDSKVNVVFKHLREQRPYWNFVKIIKKATKIA